MMDHSELWELQCEAIAALTEKTVAKVCGFEVERLKRKPCAISPDGWEKLAAYAKDRDMHDLAERFEAAGEPRS